MLTSRSRLLLAALLLLATACSESPEPERQAPRPEPATSGISDAIRQTVTDVTSAVCDTTTQLQASTSAFLDTPDIANLTRIRSEWRSAHGAYTQLLVAYQLAELQPPHIHDDRDTLDAFPVLPGYLDQVPGYPRSGLVYSEVLLTPDFLRKEHQSTDFYYATLGFHPLETLLWGNAEQGIEAQAALYRTQGNVPEDQVDSPARRVELLRLVAHQLPRDAAALCQQPQQLALMTLLSDLNGVPAKTFAAMTRTLKEQIEKPLINWQANPAGEDNNGMPVWHAPLAKTDFAEMSAQVSQLSAQWLPALLPGNNVPPETIDALSQQLTALAGRLDKHTGAGSDQTPEMISQTLGQLADALATLADHETEPEATSPPSEKASQ